MTPKHIKQWARKSGFDVDARIKSQPTYVATLDELQVFVNFIRNAALEEAAVKCGNLYAGLRIQPTRHEAASAVRSLKT
jgi:hypothetical protein